MINLWDYAGTSRRVRIKSKSGEVAKGFVIEVMDADEDEDATGDAIAIKEKGRNKLWLFEYDEIEEIGFAD